MIFSCSMIEPGHPLGLGVVVGHDETGEPLGADDVCDERLDLCAPAMSGRVGE